MYEFESTQGTAVKNAIKYSFQSIRMNGRFYTLDRKNEVFGPIYYKYATRVEDLSEEEQFYNIKINEVTEMQAIEIADLKNSLKIMEIRAKSAVGVIERLRNSFWQYLLFRLNLTHWK